MCQCVLQEPVSRCASAPGYSVVQNCPWVWWPGITKELGCPDSCTGSLFAHRRVGSHAWSRILSYWECLLHISLMYISGLSAESTLRLFIPYHSVCLFDLRLVDACVGTNRHCFLLSHFQWNKWSPERRGDHLGSYSCYR